MRLRLCEERSAVSEREVSVESDSETLGRAGCERETARRGYNVWLFRSDDRIRYCARADRDKPSCRKTERCTRASTLTCAVTTACGGPVMRPARMFGACMMSLGDAVGAVMICCFAGAMHRAGHNGSCGAAQRCDPRP